MKTWDQSYNPISFWAETTKLIFRHVFCKFRFVNIMADCSYLLFFKNDLEKVSPTFIVLLKNRLK